MALIIVQAVALTFLIGGTVLLVARRPPSISTQLAIAVIAGFAAAFVVLAHRVDLVPDQLEESLAVVVLAVLLSLAALHWLARFATR